jgi:hypothetical protein
MSNVEVMNSACRELLVERSILKKTEQSDSTLRHSTRLSSSQAAVRYSIFDTAELVAGCGSLFQLCVVSYKRFRVQGSEVEKFTPSSVDKR